MVEYFATKKVLFTRLNRIEPPQLHVRKKIEIFYGTDKNQNYHSIYVLKQKSRFLMQNAHDIEQIDFLLQDFAGHNFKYKNILFHCAICSKSKQFLSQKGWSFYNDFV